jgi:hypothetical protein
LSQQTPSAHEPERQSEPVAHVSPFDFRQLPALVAAVVSAHTEPVGHVAVEQQTLLPTPGAQWPLAHCESFVHSVPRAPVVTHVPDLHP